MILEKQVYIPPKKILPKDLALLMYSRRSEFFRLFVLKLHEMKKLYPQMKIEKIVIRFELMK